mmetsp:Transcript_30305/g.76189  ORF Transcript_30305/g.76189 Transcript_30305/m.76189 type:complete len:176 (-) Transcript_30305:21-548(-)
MACDLLVQIIGAALCSALFSEGLAYLLIYRTVEYARLQSLIEKLERKVESNTELTNTNKAKTKKKERNEELIQKANRDLSYMRMKSLGLVGVAMMMFMLFLNTHFDGIIVARLPFEPLSFMQGITHRGLPGNNPKDCSMIFFYIISSLFFRNNIQKFCGFMPSNASTLFPAPGTS